MLRTYSCNEIALGRARLDNRSMARLLCVSGARLLSSGESLDGDMTNVITLKVFVALRKKKTLPFFCLNAFDLQLKIIYLSNVNELFFYC